MNLLLFLSLFCAAKDLPVKFDGGKNFVPVKEVKSSKSVYGKMSDFDPTKELHMPEKTSKRHDKRDPNAESSPNEDLQLESVEFSKD